MDDVDEKKTEGLHSSTVSYFIVVILIFAINVLDYYYHHDDQSQDNKHDSWHPMDDEHIKRYVLRVVGLLFKFSWMYSTMTTNGHHHLGVAVGRQISP
jgi:hypothetical protein